MASDPSQQDKKPHAVPARPPPPDEALRCPRCDSSNTKFCYYNNYSLTQPRYFCKTCRRHWTKGGALRNVPIGGGCRKNKKAKTDSRLPIIYCGEDKDSSSSGMRLLHGISSSLNHNQFFPFGDLSSPAIGTSAFDSGAVISSSEGLRYPLSKVARLKECEVHVGEAHEFGPTNIHSNIGTSIEDLSYMNQDLHWKLQQQRLAMLFSGKCKETGANSQGAAPHSEGQKMPSFAFQAMGQPNELFYGNSSTLVNGSNIGNKSSSWNGIQSCNDLHRYSALQ